MVIKDSTKTLWIDLLCFKTFFIAYFRKNEGFNSICYMNIHLAFKPFVNIARKSLPGNSRKN